LANSLGWRRTPYTVGTGQILKPETPLSGPAFELFFHLRLVQGQQRFHPTRIDLRENGPNIRTTLREKPRDRSRRDERHIARNNNPGREGVAPHRSQDPAQRTRHFGWVRKSLETAETRGHGTVACEDDLLDPSLDRSDRNLRKGETAAAENLFRPTHPSALPADKNDSLQSDHVVSSFQQEIRQLLFQRIATP
jgi:hypothetical protein